jgi:alkylation response protein AidB-like acyl-CoA dehydrogenase
MDFNFKEEQQQLRRRAQALDREGLQLRRRKAIVIQAEGVSGQAWATLAELGMTALPVPEEQGGFDGTPSTCSS